jgi:hypothetical protein
MKSIAVLGMGVIALTAGAFITAGAAPGSGASYFEASVEGGMSARPAGEVAFGVVGDSATGVSAFTITLGGADSSGAILFTSLDGRMPTPGRYELSDTTADGFRAMYIAGSAERPVSGEARHAGDHRVECGAHQRALQLHRRRLPGQRSDRRRLGGEDQRRLHVHLRADRTGGQALKEERSAERERRPHRARRAESLPGARAFGVCLRRDEIEVRSR